MIVFPHRPHSITFHPHGFSSFSPIKPIETQRIPNFHHIIPFPKIFPESLKASASFHGPCAGFFEALERARARARAAGQAEAAEELGLGPNVRRPVGGSRGSAKFAAKPEWGDLIPYED